MATIITKNSSTASSVPLNTQLVQGELAVNVTDKRLFTENASGTVVELGTNPSSLTLPNGVANAVCYLNGSKVLTTGSALTFDGTTFRNTAGGAAFSGVIGAGVSASASGRFRAFNSTNDRFVEIFNDGTVSTINSTFGSAGASPLTFQISDTERMRLSADGNLGLGVTPSAWGSGFRALQVSSSALINNGSNDTFLGANYYFDGTNNRYINTDFASTYGQVNGAHLWYTAPSGTAGNAISFTQAMTLDASGNLVVGDTSTSYKLDVAKLSAASTEAAVRNTNGRMVLTQQASGGAVTQYYKDAAATYVAGVGSTLPGGSAQSALIFSDYQGSWVERARIDSSGNLLVGRTSQLSTERFAVYTASQSWAMSIENARNTSADLGAYISLGSNTNNTGSFFVSCVTAGFGARIELRGNGGIANFQANNVNLSDRREKTNFAPAGEYLSKICAIPVQTFNYIDQSEDDPGLTLGVVAQDVQAVAPELVMESDWSAEKDGSKMRLSIYQTDLQYALMKAIQELKAELDATKAELAALKGAA